MLINFGNLTQRGLRCNMCDLVKNKKSIYMSAHCLGKGVDFTCNDIDAYECRKLIREGINEFEYPIRLETDITWCHVDVY